MHNPADMPDSREHEFIDEEPWIRRRSGDEEHRVGAEVVRDAGAGRGLTDDGCRAMRWLSVAMKKSCYDFLDRLL